jgi:hypothetical protein
VPNGNGNMTGTQAFQRIALIVVGVLWAIVSVVGYTKMATLDEVRTKMTIVETLAPQAAEDHKVLMGMLADQGKREVMLTEAINIMRELKSTLDTLNARYTALQVDVIRLQSQQGGGAASPSPSTAWARVYAIPL